MLMASPLGSQRVYIRFCGRVPSRQIQMYTPRVTEGEWSPPKPLAGCVYFAIGRLFSAMCFLCRVCVVSCRGVPGLPACEANRGRDGPPGPLPYQDGLPHVGRPGDPPSGKVRSGPLESSVSSGRPPITLILASSQISTWASESPVNQHTGRRPLGCDWSLGTRSQCSRGKRHYGGVHMCASCRGPSSTCVRRESRQLPGGQVPPCLHPQAPRRRPGLTPWQHQVSGQLRSACLCLARRTAAFSP